MNDLEKGLNIKDLYNLTLVSDPKISPNNQKIVFTVTKMNEKEDTYKSNLWILDLKTREYEQYTNGMSDRAPMWSKDGKYISFLSRRTLKKEEPGVELWVKKIETDLEPRLLYISKTGISDYEWNPNGETIAFATQIGELDKDVLEIERIPFWFNGMGYVYKFRSHIFIIDVLSGNVEQVSEGDYNYYSPRWNPNGDKLAFVGQEDDEKPYENYIYVYNVKTGETERILEKPLNIYTIEWSPDGEKIAIKGSDLKRGYATHANLFIFDLESRELINLTENFDKDLTNPANSDVRGPSLSRGLQWVGHHIYTQVAVGGAVHLYRVRDENEIEPVVTGDVVIDNFWVGEKEKIAFTQMDPTNPPELYFMEKKKIEKMTGFNNHLLSKRKLVSPEKFSFKASDGATVEGWIIKPVNFEEGKKYPALLEIHGGPATTYGYGFIHEFHVLSNEGYVIIYTNPRGSSGYSEEFKDIRGIYGERDYQDLMEAVEYVSEKFEYIDTEKMGVLGGSYGGFMTNWIITHTNKFKAAVTQRSISNWISFYGTTDIGFHFGPDQMARDFEAHFWKDEETYLKYWNKSPIKYVKNAKTPLLIIHSEQDYRCWLDQALQMFTALKIRKVPTKLVIFPKENHDLSRSGKPKHREKRLEEIINWFNKYLKDGSKKE